MTGELLTGAFATKVRGDALPVLVQLRSAYSGPNDSEIPLEGCLMIGKATADLQSVRARVEAVSLSCVLPDGTLGVPGRWEFRSGRWLANLLSAMGTTAAGVYADAAIARELGAAGAILGDVGTSATTTQDTGVLPGTRRRGPAAGVDRERDAGVRGHAGGTDHRGPAGRLGLAVGGLGL